MRTSTILILLFAVIKLNGQGLTQSADGKSTIFLKGAAASIDIGKSDISFGMNNLISPISLLKIDTSSAISKGRNKFKRKNNCSLIGGFSAQAKSEEGISALFTKGELVPSASLNFFGGISLSNSYTKYTDSLVKLTTEIREREESFASEFSDQMIKAIKSEIDTSTLNEVERANRNSLLKILKKGNPTEFFRVLVEFKTDNLVLKNRLKNISEKAENIQKKNDLVILALTERLEALSNSSTLRKLHRVSIFGLISSNALSFKHFIALDTTNLSKSFEKENFVGLTIGGGINYQISNWRFGVTYEYCQTHNFDMLDKTDYTLTSSTVAHGKTLKEEKSITSYSGKYGKLNINKLNTDVILIQKLDKAANFFAYINPYLRANIFSRNKSLLVNTTDIGSGFYFFNHKKKLLGGFYIELPDVSNNIEKNKAPEDQNIQPNVQRLGFGIVTKFSISSLLGTQ